MQKGLAARWSVRQGNTHAHSCLVCRLQRELGLNGTRVELSCVSEGTEESKLLVQSADFAVLSEEAGLQRMAPILASALTLSFFVSWSLMAASVNNAPRWTGQQTCCGADIRDMRPLCFMFWARNAPVPLPRHHASEAEQWPQARFSQAFG